VKEGKRRKKEARIVAKQYATGVRNQATGSRIAMSILLNIRYGNDRGL